MSAPRRPRFCSVSGSRIMMTSASAAASAIGTTRSPAASALAFDDEPVTQADAHVDARVLQVQRVGVALRAVADDRDLAAGDQRAVGVLLVVHVGCHQLAFPFSGAETGQPRAPTWAARPGRCAAARRCRTAAAAPRSRRPCRVPVERHGERVGADAEDLALEDLTSSMTWPRCGPRLARSRAAARARPRRAGRARWIFTTLISLSSCLTICSSGADSTSTTIVMRLNRSSSVGATASE